VEIDEPKHQKKQKMRQKRQLSQSEKSKILIITSSFFQKFCKILAKETKKK